MTGRFAPSPSGRLHLGNLRTALLAWLVARSRGGSFVVRMEDLDPVVATREHEVAQLRDLAALGLDWDGPVWRQSERGEAYAAALDRLAAAGLTYDCYCTRREIRDAAAAPHGGELVYPGTCRDLRPAERAARARDRPPALRFASDRGPIELVDELAGPFRGAASDVVLRRNDGVLAYNLAVVVDDAAQGIDEVVRADDLLAATPTQVALQRALGVPTPRYLHVPLVVNDAGERLAKRDGAVTLDDLDRRGCPVGDVRDGLLRSLGVPEPDHRVRSPDLATRLRYFDLAAVRRLGRRPVAARSLGLPIQP